MDLPDFVLLSSVHAVEEFMKEHNLTPSASLHTRTVRKTVCELLLNGCFQKSETVDGLVSKGMSRDEAEGCVPGVIANEVMKMLEEDSISRKVCSPAPSLSRPHCLSYRNVHTRAAGECCSERAEQGCCRSFHSWCHQKVENLPELPLCHMCTQRCCCCDTHLPLRVSIIIPLQVSMVICNH